MRGLGSAHPQKGLFFFILLYYTNYVTPADLDDPSRNTSTMGVNHTSPLTVITTVASARCMTKHNTTRSGNERNGPFPKKDLFFSLSFIVLHY